jgi:hypothetical protein
VHQIQHAERVLARFDPYDSLNVRLALKATCLFPLRAWGPSLGGLGTPQHDTESRADRPGGKGGARFVTDQASTSVAPGRLPLVVFSLLRLEFGSNREIAPMTDDLQRVQIEKARLELVKQRHSIIEALAKGYERGQTESHVELLLKIQSAIDVLDSLELENEEEEDDD